MSQNSTRHRDAISGSRRQARHLIWKPGVTFPTSCSAAKVAAFSGRRRRRCIGISSTSSAATQPTFKQWSRTEIPGSPSGVVLAQKRHDVTACSLAYFVRYCVLDRRSKPCVPSDCDMHSEIGGQRAPSLNQRSVIANYLDPRGPRFPRGKKTT